jgi:hypothetical protein
MPPTRTVSSSLSSFILIFSVSAISSCSHSPAHLCVSRYIDIYVAQGLVNSHTHSSYVTNLIKSISIRPVVARERERESFVRSAIGINMYTPFEHVSMIYGAVNSMPLFSNINNPAAPFTWHDELNITDYYGFKFERNGRV